MTVEQTSRIASQLLRATLAHFDAERQAALAVLDIYLHKPVGISDHPNILSEIITSTRKLAEAEDAISSLEKYFLSNEEKEHE